MWSAFSHSLTFRKSKLHFALELIFKICFKNFYDTTHNNQQQKQNTKTEKSKKQKEKYVINSPTPSQPLSLIN